MGLFDAIFRPSKANESIKALHDATGQFETLTAYKPVYTTWGGRIYESEIVRAAIDARARHISKLKIETFGTANPALQAKLKQGMNQWQTNSQFLYRLSTILDIHNTAFIVPVFDERMIITGYYPILPTRCEIIDYKGEPWLRYQFRNRKVAAVEFRKCAILTKFQYDREFFGDTNAPLHETMQVIHIQNQGIEEAVKNASTFRFMAQLSNFSKPDDVANEAKRFTRENLASDSDTGGFLLFPNTYKDIKQIDVKPYTIDEGQMKVIRDNVFNYFGVNESVLQSKTVGDQWAAFYEGAIEPFAIQFSEAMTKAIFTERERAQGSYLMATANRLQYMSTADKLQVSAQMADRGLMTINEIRDIWNLPPVENGDRATIRGEYYYTDEPTEETNEANEGVNNAD